MAGVTSAIIAGGSAIAQTVSSIDSASKAKNAIRNFDRQDLTNPYEDVEISREASDQQTEANLVNTATAIEALRRGGTRAVIGGVPKINRNNIVLQDLISEDLDRQEKNRQLLIARGEERIQGIQEGREVRALAGLGQQLQTARQDTVSGIGNLISSGLAFDSLQIDNNEIVDDNITSGFSNSLLDINSFDFNTDNASIFDTTNSSLT